MRLKLTIHGTGAKDSKDIDIDWPESGKFLAIHNNAKVLAYSELPLRSAAGSQVLLAATIAQSNHHYQLLSVRHSDRLRDTVNNNRMRKSIILTTVVRFKVSTPHSHLKMF